jgi:response regulator NasT
MTEDLNILVIDADADRAAILEQGLVEAGYGRVMTIRTMTDLVRRVQLLEPDMIIIDLENPDRDTLEGMFQVSQQVERPIAMFVDQSDSEMIGKAMAAGVSAYVVDGLKKERIKPVVDVAVSRFRAMDQLKRERDEARTALADRKVIDRAKGLLMDKRSLSEEEAYGLLRKTAMKQNKNLAEIADSVITAFQMEI